MKLLEMFLLMERTDRLNYIAQNMQKKIFDRWEQHVEEAGLAGVPQAWRSAINSGHLPNPEDYYGDWTDTHSKKMAEWIVDWFSQFDPSRNKKYTKWLIEQWIAEDLWLEDVSKAERTLETFDAHKKNLKKMDIPDTNNSGAIPPPERRSDINAWKGYNLLAYVLRPLTGTQAAGEKVSNFLKKPEIRDYMNHPVPDPVKAFGRNGEFDFDELRSNYVGADGEDIFDTMDWYNDFTSKPDDIATPAIKPIYKSDRLAVLQPNTKAASCELGKGTEWCTAYTDADNYFWNYAPDGPLYVILTDKMGRFQFHFESNQFKDVHDDELSDKDKDKLIAAYPELKEIFAKPAIHPLHGENSLVDPSVWTLEKIKEYIAEGDEISLTTILQKIKPWKDKLPEEVLQYLEALARKKAPSEAWGYLRNPTEDDFEHSILARVEDGTPESLYKMVNTVGHALAHGIQLDDSVLNAAVDATPRTLQNIPAERIRKNPEWVIRALAGRADSRRVFHDVSKVVSSRSTIPYPGDFSPDQATAVMDVIRNHPKGKQLLDSFSGPEDVMSYLDYFGTEPWMKAYAEAPSTQGMNSMAATIAGHANSGDTLDLDYPKLLTFLLNNDILHITTLQCIEVAMGGELPIEFQQEILKKNPAALVSLENPHTRLEYEAHRDMGNGGRAERQQKLNQ